MIRLKPEVAALATTDLDGLRVALQTAIELEHATLPPYLYALYSIKPGANQRVGGILKSIVLQEMLHLALCCNVLNAIGGRPVLNRPGFIPGYPGPLPGGVESGLKVPLAPLSKLLVHDVFMVIEEPETPLEFPVLGALAAAVAPPLTIGQFYKLIKRKIAMLSAAGDIFTGDPARQLSVGLPGLRAVTDARSAAQAIDLIVVQGEGTTTSPLDAAHEPAHELAHEPAHYYRFAEIYNGRMLVPRDGHTPAYAYAGDPVPFADDGVWPVVANPTPEAYAGTPAAVLNDRFNYTYTSLLNSLHRTFNGEPAAIGAAIGLMESAKQQALAMMSTEFAPGRTSGPTFTYRPVE